MPSIPVWLLNLIIQVAIKVGLPWVITKFPKIPSEVVAIIEQLIKDLNNTKVSNSVSKKIAIAMVRNQLQITPQPQDLKKG